MQTQNPSPFQEVIGLGALKQAWANNAKSKWVSLVFGVACLAATPVLLLLAAYFGYNAYNNSGLRRVDEAVLPWLCIGAVAFVIGAVAVYNTWRNWKLAAALFEQGVAYRKRGPVEQFRWDDIDAVWQAVTKHYYNGVYTGTTHIYTVQLRDGRKPVFNDGFGKDIEALGRALQMGQKVTFGPLALDRDKLYAGKKELPWGEIKAIKIEKGNISVKKDKGWFAWASATVPQIPNFFVFYELVGRFAKVE